MSFNIKKGQVHGYCHNAPKLRDKSVSGIIAETNNLIANPKLRNVKTTSVAPYIHNAPEIRGQAKGRKFGGSH